MNGRRMFLGGLLAGLVYLVGGLMVHALADFLFKEAFAKATALMQPSLGLIFGNVVIRLGFGLVTVWLYAVARPRLGPGPKTALKVALTLWFAAYVPYIWALGNLRIFPWGMLGVVGVWGIAENSVAALTGGWFYREN